MSSSPQEGNHYFQTTNLKNYCHLQTSYIKVKLRMKKSLKKHLFRFLWTSLECLLLDDRLIPSNMLSWFSWMTRDDNSGCASTAEDKRCIVIEVREFLKSMFEKLFDRLLSHSRLKMSNQNFVLSLELVFHEKISS